MYRWKRIALTLSVVLGFVALAGLGTSTHAVLAARSNVIGQVYVNDNTAGANTVAGFDRYADGALTPLPGSPFVVGGAGTGTVTGSQGALQLSSDGRYLLAVDAGSNQISVLSIGQDGQIQPVNGSPFWSGGVEPVSLAVHNNLVYVANTGAGGTNYSGFTFDESGRLTLVAGSTIGLPAGSGPGDVLFNANGTRLVGTRVNTSLIDSFVVGSDGRLTSAPGSPFPAQAQGPFGSAFRPTNPYQLFVSNAHAGTDNGTISAYHDAYDGTLNSIGASPFADDQTAPCWVTITSDGQYLFAVNTASDTISRFAISADGTLALLGSTLLNDAGPTLSPFDIGVDWSGHYAYVVDAGLDSVSALLVNNGALTELSSSPFSLPTGATPFGIVVD